MSMWSISRAFTIAFITAGGAPIAPASPHPFIPRGLLGVGVLLNAV